MLVAVRPASGDDAVDLDRATIRRYLAADPVVLRPARIAPKRIASAAAEGLAIAFVIVVLVGTLVGILLVMVRNEIGLVRADTPIAEWAATNATDSGATLMRELSKFGGTEYVLIGAVVVTAIAVSRDRRSAVPLYVVSAMIGQFLVSNSIKWIVERARPGPANLTGLSGTSFPCGHVVAGDAAWACVAFLLGRDGRKPSGRLCTVSPPRSESSSPARASHRVSAGRPMSSSVQSSVGPGSRSAPTCSEWPARVTTSPSRSQRKPIGSRSERRVRVVGRLRR